MPLYEYRCTQCGHRFEKIQSFNAEPELECPKCQGALIRPLTAPAFQFKGAGWYVNDYAAKSSAKSSESTPAAQADSKPASETKSATASQSAKSGPAPATPAPATT